VQLEENDTYGYKVVIASSYFDVSVLRVPCNMTVTALKVQRGTRVAQKSKLFYDLNENAVINLSDSSGHSIQIIHRLTRSFAPLCLDISNNDKLVKLSHYGVMLCGVTELYFSKDFKSNITVGEKVSAAESILGHC
jgi:phosphatidylserine decarboxylase